MKQLKKIQVQENVVYLIIWVVLFLIPVAGMVINTAYDPNRVYHWNGVIRMWGTMAIFLVIFLIHNFLIAPQIIYKHKTMRYFAWMTLLLAAFIVVDCSTDSVTVPHNHNRNNDTTITLASPPPMPRPGLRRGYRPEPGPPPQKANGDDAKPPMDVPTIVSLFFFVAMCMSNLGIKQYFKSMSDRERLHELKHEQTQQELAYLRYQVNPHFFMNTLNNIHALIDMDPSKAKRSVIDLSHLMRYVLYQGTKDRVTLKQGLDFLNDYTQLMRMRFSDSVDIQLNTPAKYDDSIVLAPLMVIPFLENAFKHGVSYSAPSFIHLDITIEGENIKTVCANSNHHRENSKEQGGVGLVNVKKRLDLVYEDRYTLDIDNQPDVFTVTLVVPIEHNTSANYHSQ